MPRASTRSIAVLPFRDLGGDSANAYLGDGVSQEILDGLSQVPGLAVVGRASSFRFRGAGVDVRAVGRTLDVGTLLSGTVQRADSAVRVTAELVDTRTGLQLWSGRYDRRMRGLFALEDDIARNITDTLRLRFTGVGLVHTGTESPEAHDLVLRAQHVGESGTKADIDSATALLQRALALDSTYADAWATLAGLYEETADEYAAPRDMVPLAEHAALRAIALDSSGPLGHLALGIVRLDWQWRFAEARREFDQAIAMAPGLGFAHAWRGVYAQRVDQDYARAQRELRLAAALDPLDPQTLSLQFGAAVAARDYGGALDFARRLQVLTRSSVFYGDNPVATVYAAQGNWQVCARAYDSIPQTQRGDETPLAICEAHLGNRHAAREILARLQARPYVDRVQVAAILVALGDTSGAFIALDRAFADRSAGLLALRDSRALAPLHDHPRFRALLARMGLPPSGPPPGD